MNKLLRKLINKKPFDDRDLADALYQICEDTHASCDNNCPVYELNHGCVGANKPFAINCGCDCFKNGKAMLTFLREH
jgi:hypothetical protein